LSEIGEIGGCCHDGKRSGPKKKSNKLIERRASQWQQKTSKMHTAAQSREDNHNMRVRRIDQCRRE
jgi:hypothetical protein